MKSRPLDPARLDIAAFIAEGTELRGDWPAAELSRLDASQSPPQDTMPSALSWRAQGERVAVAGAEPEQWLHLSAHGDVWLTCQRCLQPFQQSLAVDAKVRFVRDEAQAEALDAELEEDVLALPRWLDLRTLIEDELLLALPLVPRHERCPEPLPTGSSDRAEDEDQANERPNPFAVLQALKTGKSGNKP